MFWLGVAMFIINAILIGTSVPITCTSNDWFIVPTNVYEKALRGIFNWIICVRPPSRIGFGWTTNQRERERQRIATAQEYMAINVKSISYTFAKWLDILEFHLYRCRRCHFMLPSSLSISFNFRLYGKITRSQQYLHSFRFKSVSLRLRSPMA